MNEWTTNDLQTQHKYKIWLANTMVEIFAKCHILALHLLNTHWK